MEGKNTQDIIPLVELTRDMPVSVRFIEEMPFNGDDHTYKPLVWDYVKIFSEIKSKFMDIEKKHDPAFSTSSNYHIPGHEGDVGIIAAYSRTFCGTCNRIRVTPEGMVKTCLYDNGVLNIKDHMRSGANDEELINVLLNALGNRPKDGWEAEHNRIANGQGHESMATIGG